MSTPAAATPATASSPSASHRKSIACPRPRMTRSVAALATSAALLTTRAPRATLIFVDPSFKHSVHVAAETPASKANITASVGTRASLSHPEEIPPPPGQKIDEEHEQGDHQDPAHADRPTRELGDLLLTSDRTLLQLQRPLGRPPILREMLALRVTDLAQELSGLVATVHAALLVGQLTPHSLSGSL